MSSDVTDRQIRRMVSNVNPYWNIKQIERGFHSSDFVSRLTIEENFEDTFDVFLKANTCRYVPEIQARVEPHILKKISRTTDVPVPCVLEICNFHSEHPTPYYITEYVSGVNARQYSFTNKQIKKFVEDAALNLSRIHEIETFEKYGFAGVGNAESRIKVLDSDKYESFDCFKGWIQNYLDLTAGYVRSEMDIFNELIEKLVDGCRSLISNIDRDNRSPRLCHWDYRPGNVLVDPNSGVTKSVLDFGSLYVTDTIFNIAKFESHLISPYREPDKLDRNLIDLFISEYEDNLEEWCFDSNTEKKMRACQLVCLVDKVRSFNIRYENLSPESKSRKISDYKKAGEIAMEELL